MLKILKHDADSHTGHISVELQVVENPSPNNTVLGASETHGIAAHELETKFGGDVNAWLRWVHDGMKRRHEDRKIAANAMNALKGKTLFNDEDTDGNQTAPSGTEL